MEREERVMAMSDMISKIDHSSKFRRAKLAVSRRRLLPTGLSCLVLAALFAFQSTPEASAAPAPGASTWAEAWTLNFKPGPLRLYVDPITGQTYRYFTYRVINSTGKDHMFAPRIELFTDKGEILRSGRGVPSEVTRRLRGVLNDPLLEDENQILGDLKQGKENAKDGLVIWAASDLDSNDLTIFVTGLSNDIVRVPHPLTGEDVTLRKTLRLDYHVAGNAADQPSQPAGPATPVTTERSIQLHPDIANGIWIWR